MKNNIPFVRPERDINLRVIRFLIIAEKLSYTQRGKFVLNIEKIILFDFLVEYPYLLKDVMWQKNQRYNLKLNEEEIGSIATLYPSKTSLLDNSPAKTLIKLMVSNELLLVKEFKNELFFVISDIGKKHAESIKTDYIYRIRELCENLLGFRSTSTSQLKKMINKLIKGV